MTTSKRFYFFHPQVWPDLAWLWMFLAIPGLHGWSPGIWSVGYEVHQQVKRKGLLFSLSLTPSFIPGDWQQVEGSGRWQDQRMGLPCHRSLGPPLTSLPCLDTCQLRSNLNLLWLCSAQKSHFDTTTFYNTIWSPSAPYPMINLFSPFIQFSGIWLWALSHPLADGTHFWCFPRHSICQCQRYSVIRQLFV